MPSYSISEAKDNLSKLIDLAEAGEEVILTRHGKEVARLKAPLSASGTQRGGMSKEWADQLRAWRKTATPLEKPAVDLVRDLRDEPIIGSE